MVQPSAFCKWSTTGDAHSGTLSALGHVFLLQDMGLKLFLCCIPPVLQQWVLPSILTKGEYKTTAGAVHGPELLRAQSNAAFPQSAARIGWKKIKKCKKIMPGRQNNSSQSMLGATKWKKKKKKRIPESHRHLQCFHQRSFKQLVLQHWAELGAHCVSPSPALGGCSPQEPIWTSYSCGMLI